MELFSSFDAVVCVAREMPKARPLEKAERAAPAGPEEIPALLQVADGALGDGARTATVFGRRLAAGMSAFLLSRDGVPAAYVWAARGGYDIFPLRIRLTLPERGAYLFDEATIPKFRRQGLLGKLIRHAWETLSLSEAAVCIREDNRSSLEANGRLGFEPASDIHIRRFGLLRRQDVVMRPGGARRRFWSRATRGPNPRILECRIGAAEGRGIECSILPAAAATSRGASLEDSLPA